MRDFLNTLSGKKIDVVCSGGVAVRGEVVSVTEDILTLKDDEEKVCYIAIDKVTVVWETKDKQPRSGFIGGFAKKIEVNS